MIIRTVPPGNPDAVLNAIDEYGWTTGFLMNIGDRKGAIMDRVIDKHQPKVEQLFDACIHLVTNTCHAQYQIAQMLWWESKPQQGEVYKRTFK